MKLSKESTALLDGTALDVPPVSSKIVRVFLSSTFSDTKEERNTLLSETIPRLKDYARDKYGVEFQLVDMRWGVTNDAQNDHMTAEVCIQEIKNCQRVSAGPNFVALIGQKYGYRPFPPFIDSDEFEAIREALVNSGEDLTILDSWFNKNTNTIPPQYVLRPISSVLPHFQDKDKAKREKDQEKWNVIFVNLSTLLRMGATLCRDSGQMDAKEVEKYFISVTEVEIQQGLFHSENDVKRKCLCFLREIENLDENLSNPKASTFTDLDPNTGEINEEAQQLLKTLKIEKIRNYLPKENIVNLTVRWEGKECISSDTHYMYLGKFSDIFYEKLVWLIDENLRNTEHIQQDELLSETIQHLHIRNERSEIFYGREDILLAVKSYIVQKKSRQPMVLYGESGCGKSAAIAKSASLTSEWLRDKKAVIISKYLGVTPKSTKIRLTLALLCTQISLLYNVDIKEVPTDYPLLMEYFKQLLQLSSETRPLVIFLDALDQLSTCDNALSLNWLPQILSEHTQLIVSFVPDKFNLLEKMKERFCTDGLFVQVPPLGDALSKNILQNLLSFADKKLTQEQTDIVNSLFTKCSLPLFTKVIFDEICHWCSFTDIGLNTVASTVRGAINHFFDRLEIQHGKTMIKHAMAYLTASRDGLSEVELIDIMSLDDDVLNSIFLFWLPPTRRLPTFLWTRIRIDLKNYLVKRDIDGIDVMAWYHREFEETCKDRYMQDDEFVKKIHSCMADYFLGTWSEGKKMPFQYNSFFMGHVGLTRTLSQADRKVPSQPIVYQTAGSTLAYNIRKLNELPIQLLKSGRIDELLGTVVFNYKWLYYKIRATGLHQLLLDFLEIVSVLANPEIDILRNALRIAGQVLNDNPDNLGFEISARLMDYYDSHIGIRTLIAQCDEEGISRSAFVPHRQLYDYPTRALLHSLDGNSAEVSDILLLKGGKELWSISKEGKVDVWDMVHAELQKRLDFSGSHTISAVSLLAQVTRDEKYVICISRTQFRTITILSVEQYKVSHIYKLKSALVHHRLTVGTKFVCMDNAVFEVASCKMLHRLSRYVHSQGFVCTAITWDDKHLLIGSGNAVLMFDLLTCVKITTMRTDNIASTVDVSIDDKYVIIGQSIDCKIKIYDIMPDSQKFSQQIAVFDHNGCFPAHNFTYKSNLCLEVSDVEISQSGKYFVSLIKRLYVICFSLKDTSADPVLMTPPTSGSKFTYLISVAISADDKLVLAAELSSNIHLWDRSSGNLLVTHAAHCNDIRKTLVAQYTNVAITVAQDDISIKVWDIEQLQKEGESVKESKDVTSVKHVKTVEKHDIMFVSNTYPLCTNKSFHYIDFFSLACINLCTGNQSTLLPFDQYGQLHGLEVSEEGDVIILMIGTAAKCVVHFFDVVQTTYICAADFEEFEDVQLSPDRSYCAVLLQGETPTVKVFQFPDMKEVFLLSSCTHAIFTSATTLYGVKQNNEVSVVQLPTLEVTTNKLVMPSQIDSVHYVKETGVIIFLCSDGDGKTGFIYNAARYEKIGKLENISPHGIRDVADNGSICIDGNLQVFDIQQCKPVHRLERSSEHELTQVCLSHNGQHAIWIDTEPTDCITVARVHRNVIIGRCCLHAIPETLRVVNSSNTVIVRGRDKQLYILALCDPDFANPIRAAAKQDRINKLFEKNGNRNVCRDYELPVFPDGIQEQLKQRAKKDNIKTLNVSIYRNKSRDKSSSSACALS